MGWTNPKTWAVEPLVATDLNTHVRDNLNHLHDRMENCASHQITTDYTTTSTTFVDIDTTNLNLTLTTTGGKVLCGFFGAFENPTSGSRAVYLDVEVDGTRFGDTADGVIGSRFGGSGDPGAIGFVILIDGLSDGAHDFKLQWRGDLADSKLEGTDSASQFWVKEI